MPTNNHPDSNQGKKAPPKCLSFTISGQWGHFKKIEGNIVKGTYKIIPRTTLAGLVAAILGLPRDSYYDIFSPKNSKIAIEPISRLRTMNMAINTLSTNKSSLTNVTKGQSLTLRLPDPQKNRQQHTYEVLVDPSYRIDLWLRDDTMYKQLRTALKQGKSQYTPSLGLSEHIANITYHGEFTPTQPDTNTDPATVDSIIPGDFPNVIPQPNKPHSIERSPSQMQKDGEKTRIRTSSRTIAYSQTGESLQVKGISPITVDGRNVIFD